MKTPKMLLVCMLTPLLNVHVAVCAPPNDNCAAATPVGNVTNLHFNTTQATFDGPGICTYVDGANIWYRYTATETACVTVSLCGSLYDTKLAVYYGASCPVTQARLIECNDDYCDRQSQVSFQAIAGRQYLIEIGGFSDRTGQGLMSISSCSEPPYLPPYPLSNDDCENARSVGDVTNLHFDTTEATFDGPGRYMTSRNIWYRYTATCTGEAIISLCGSSFDTKLAVYNGGACWPSASRLIAYNDDYCGQQSQVTFSVTAGNQYLIEVGGWSQSDYGQGLISISCEGQPYPPSNDDCENAMSVGDVTNLQFDTTEATFDGPGRYMTTRNVWYRYTATCTGEAVVSLCGSSFDTKLAVYNGGACWPSASRLIAYNDDYCGQQSQVTFSASAGNQYLIEVGGWSQSDYGLGVISISCEQVYPYPEASDLGDAPDSTNNFGRVMTAYPKGGPMGTQANYPTVLNDGTFGLGPYGPVHLNSLAVAHLGKSITHETEADIGSDADGLNNITPLANSSDQDGADDGVIFPLNLPHCHWTTFDYIVNVTTPGTDLWVNVWFDWNRDGDWDDTLTCSNQPAPEWAVQNQYLFNLPAGLNQLTTPAFLPWHPQYGTKKLWMRITLSEQPWTGGSTPGAKGNGGSGPVEGYEVGETEDYYFTPDTSAPSHEAMCQDLNGDGIVNIEDCITYVTEWLDSCP